MKATKGYSPEIRERAVRLVLDQQADHGSQWAAIGSIASKIGCTAETLRRWVRETERDQGLRAAQKNGNQSAICALLAPDIVEAVVAGDWLPPVPLRKLNTLPAEWDAQRRMLGFDAI